MVDGVVPYTRTSMRSAHFDEASISPAETARHHETNLI
jgi:hypothetical protein